MMLFKNLKKEVQIGANGTLGYVIKQGVNKGKKIKQKTIVLFILSLVR